MEIKKCIFYSMVVFSVLLMQGCSKKKNLESLSPSQIVDLYNKARNECDTELLRKIIYFPPETPEDQKDAKIKSILADSGEKALMRFVGAKGKAKYQRFLDRNTAEVGTVVYRGIAGVGMQHPTDQLFVLTEDDGIWKYHYSIWELTEEQLIEQLRANPDRTSLYYILGFKIQPENPPKAHRFFLKYYELEPDGFWASDGFISRLKEFKKEYDNTELYETEKLAEIESLPENRAASKAIKYRQLGQLFVELKNYEKAKIYFNNSEKILEKNSFPLEVKSLNAAREKLRLCLEGKYHDILDEIEQNK